MTLAFDRADVKIELYENNRLVDFESGEIQLTDYGISGICVFNLSHYVSRGLSNDKREVMKINFVPFASKDIYEWMEEYNQKNPHKNLKDMLEGFLNCKLARIIILKSHLLSTSTYSSLGFGEKQLLCENLKHFPVEIIDTKGFDYGQICSGGVRLNEINSNTMESKKVKGLYVVGELLDLNGICGGYNLTTCWISGILAGRSLGDMNDLFETN